MSDIEVQEDKPFCVEIAKQGRAGCKKCKEKCLQGEVRIAKNAPNPFGDGKMKNWHHVDCLFEQFLKQRPSTKRLESSLELEGFASLPQDKQDLISQKFEDYEKLIAQKHGKTYSPRKFQVSNDTSITNVKTEVKPTPVVNKINSIPNNNKERKDNSFREFRRLVAGITNVSSYTEKSALVSKLFTKGTDGHAFKGDTVLWCRLLLPGIEKRIYNLQSKQLIKLFSRLFETDHTLMLEHLEQGDIGETIQHFYEQSIKCRPPKKSQLTLMDIDLFLEQLSKLTKEDEQTEHFKLFAGKCTANDLKIIIRLIKHDLRMNAGAKHILEGVHHDAYQAYQSSRDIKTVIERCLGGSTQTKATIGLLTPVLPMLAEACKSVEQAMKKCPNGMFSEIKYDGERVQVHKKGNEFRYYSRSLKPVVQHKVAHFKDFISKAFPYGKDLILDSEILMIDTNTGKPLPFGTLGKHKKTEFQDACVCLFVFDCIYYNDEILTNKPLNYRKKILKENMTEIENHIMFSEMEEIHKPQDLANMIGKVLKLGLEGLVLKDIKSIYEPGKRHWLKVKKDYLLGGAMADSADLIVLGAWYGTGKKGGMMSVFLMGVHDPIKNNFSTVTKVHTGHDDKALDKLQSELDMIKISGDINKVPSWLKCTKTMIPDFVAKDPKCQPIWEITGAEFTQQHDVHTADGISIRFPRVTKIRTDKNWETATNLQELSLLFKNSKENFDADLLTKKLGFDNNGQTNILEKVEPAKIKNNKRNKKETNSKVKIKKPRLVEIKNPLPDYFNNISLLLEFGVAEKYTEILRHFVAYSGVILKQHEFGLATHVLHDSDWVSEESMNCPKKAKHITIGWIEDSILQKNLLNYLPYLVKLIPSKRKVICT